MSPSLYMERNNQTPENNISQRRVERQRRREQHRREQELSRFVRAQTGARFPEQADDYAQEVLINLLTRNTDVLGTSNNWSDFIDHPAYVSQIINNVHRDAVRRATAQRRAPRVGPSWQTDPSRSATAEDPPRERYWDGSAWTDRVRTHDHYWSDPLPAGGRPYRPTDRVMSVERLAQEVGDSWQPEHRAEISRAQDLAFIDSVTNALPENQSVLVDDHLADRPLHEVANELGISYTAANSRLVRARQAAISLGRQMLNTESE